MLSPSLYKAMASKNREVISGRILSCFFCEPHYGVQGVDSGFRVIASACGLTWWSQLDWACCLYYSEAAPRLA